MSRAGVQPVGANQNPYRPPPPPFPHRCDWSKEDTEGATDRAGHRREPARRPWAAAGWWGGGGHSLHKGALSPRQAPVNGGGWGAGIASTEPLGPNNSDRTRRIRAAKVSHKCACMVKARTWRFPISLGWSWSGRHADRDEGKKKGTGRIPCLFPTALYAFAAMRPAFSHLLPFVSPSRKLPKKNTSADFFGRRGEWGRQTPKYQ